jgi:hypothetical protein
MENESNFRRAGPGIPKQTTNSKEHHASDLRDRIECFPKRKGLNCRHIPNRNN